MKKNNIRKYILPVTALVLTVSFSMVVTASPSNRRGNIKSYGRIMAEKQDGSMKGVIDASDLIYLADEIDNLENTYKSETLKSLNDIGTFFMANGSTTHNPSESEINENAASELTFAQLNNAIKSSQSIPQNDNSGSEIVGAIEDNLSKGTAAWVDGELIVGTGADNNSYYNQGYSDGYAEKTGSAEIEYIYHQHLDANGNISTAQTQTRRGGCYATGVHVHGSSCSSTTNTGVIASVCVSENSDGKELQWVTYPCTLCGWPGHTSGYTTGWVPLDERRVDTYHCSETIWHCGSPVNTYKLSCGKTEKSIEKAVITYK